MVGAKKKASARFFMRLRRGCAALACLLLYGTFFGCHPVPEAPVDQGLAGRSLRPMDVDPKAAEAIGREALETIGYLPILNLARKAGWVTTKRVRTTLGGERLYLGMNVAQTAVAAGEAAEVFSKYAVAAGVTSQFDSPFPGPFDVVAVGIVVIGLVHVALLSSHLLTAYVDMSKPVATGTTSSPSTTTKSEPKPAPQGEPKTTGTTSPPNEAPDCPRNESFTPEHTDNATGCTDRNGQLRCYSRRHHPCAGVHTHGILSYQKIRNGICIRVHKEAVRCDGPFVISGPCGSVPTVKCMSGGPETSGIYEQK